MADWTAKINQAYRQIAASGATIVLVKPHTAGTYYPATDTYGAGTATVTFETYGVMTNYSESFIGDVIEQGDKRVLIPAKGATFTLKQGHKVRIAGSYWNVVNSNPLEPGGEVIMYKAQVRQ